MTAQTTDIPATAPPPGAWRRPLSYLVFTVLPAIAAFLLVHHIDGGGGTGRPPGTSTPVPPIDTILPRMLLGIGIVVVVSHLVGSLATRLGQPRVLGEIFAGILLGPTVLGAVLPGVSVFAPSTMPLIDALAQLGVIFFMFRVGRELPVSLLRGTGATAVVIGHAGIAVPFLGGVLLALGPLASLRPAGASELAFVVMCGITLSITAFPVLARILEERSLRDTRIGALGMATAGITDVSAWCLLALVMAVVRGTSAGGAVKTVVLTIAFAAVMWWVVRPLLARIVTALAGWGRGGAGIMVVLLLVVLMSTAATDAIGISTIFGAFMAGLVVPRSTPVEEFAFRLDGPTNWLLLPLFFAGVGFKTNLWSLQASAGWLVVVAVVATAIAGKLLGVVLPARLAGLDTRSSVAVGSMMNCRGLTEIVVLNLGLSAGVISPPLFMVLLVMTLVTTAMTGPLLGLVLPGRTADTLLPGHR